MTSISFSLTPEVLALMNSPRRGLLVFAAGYSLAVIAFGVGVYLATEYKLLAGIAIGAGLTILWSAIRNFAAWAGGFRKIGNEPGGNMIFESQVLTLTDEGIWTHWKGGRQMFVPWSQFIARVETEVGTALKYSPLNFVWVPSNAFTAEGLRELNRHISSLPVSAVGRVKNVSR